MPARDHVYYPPEDAPMAPGAADRPPPDPNFDMALVKRPLQRMYITDLRSLHDANERKEGGGLAEHTLTAQFNPTELDEQWRISWVRLESPGLSHRPMQYMGTENPGYSFNLIFDARAERGGLQTIMKARAFLTSLCVPRRGATSVKEGQAPRVAFIWPNFLHLTCVLTELGFKYELFDATGTPVRYTASVKLEAIEDLRFYSEDLRESY